MAPRLGFTAFVRGSIHEQIDALQELLDAGRSGGRPRFARSRGSPMWVSFPDSGTLARLTELTGATRRGWRLELAEHGDCEADGSGAWWQLADLPPVLGMERASYVRVLLASDASATALAELGDWSINRLRLWWGAGGFMFHHTRGSPAFAARRMAALAKRHWAVQIQDMAALQWDALRGMPGVNWLTLIGDEFAQSCGLTTDKIASQAAVDESRGVFHRRGLHGIALAAGSRPSSGDINLGDDLTNYARIAQLVEPLLLVGHTPLSGPFARPEVLAAWSRRFVDPQTWLACNIAAS
jgi:hypothetical protein